MKREIKSYVNQAREKVSEEGPAKFVTDSLSWGSFLTRKYFKRNIKKDCVANPRQYIYVHPQEIETMLTSSEYVDWIAGEEIDDEIVDLYDPQKARFLDKYNIGLIIGGDWDKYKKPHDEDLVYKSIKQRFACGDEWEDTEYVQNSLEKINRGYEAFGYKSLEEFKRERLVYVEELYDNIIQNGYKEQSQIENNGYDFFHEISVNIGRDGDIIFNNSGGHHRLALSKNIGLKEIPVIVIVRHRRWQDIREKIINVESPMDFDDEVKKHLTHPDIKGVICDKDWVEDI